MRTAALILLVLCVACPAYGATPQPVPEARLAGILAKAPAPPQDCMLGMTTRLIDYIDCTDPSDPHDFRDQGTSSVVEGPAGRYRVTAAHRHAFFSYAVRTAGRDKPVLIVIEYPDDAERLISYMTHDSMRPASAHVSFSQETGVYTGNPLPLTNKMQHFTLVSWPQDDWSPLIVMNFGRAGGAGAASRIWVYSIDGMPPLAVEPADPQQQRTLDAFFCLGFLAKRDNFGWKSPRSIEHMVDYLRLIGANRATMMLYANQGWGAMCTVPAWDTDDEGYLDDILTQMDRKGGDVGLIVGIVADGMYGSVTAGGERLAGMPAEKVREVVLKGFDQLIDRYGKYRSLRGFALGSMEAPGFCDLLRRKGVAEEVVAHIHERRPDLEVLTYVGNIRLQRPYFSGIDGGTAGVVSRWEASGTDWSQFLADEVAARLDEWGQTPSALKAIPGLHVYEKFHPDDCRMTDQYSQEPRAMIYHDVDRSQEKSRMVDTPYAGIFSLFTEGHIGFHPDVNFWYGKYWTAPDINAAAPFAVAPWARALAHRDRQVISAGTWTVKYLGLDPAMRRFALAFRALPPVDMQDVSRVPVDTVKVRWAVYKGKRYVYAVSLVPFEQTIEIDGKAVTLEPFGLFAMSDGKSGEPSVTAEPSQQYREYVAGRIGQFQALCDQLDALDAKAAPAAYRRTLKKASEHLAAGRCYAADIAVGPGLTNELRLRRDILDPPQLRAPRVATAPPMTGDLDAWPASASDLRAEDGGYLAAHTFFPNSWQGPDDLSLRLRLAHDGQRLYLGLHVRDQALGAEALNVKGGKGSQSDSCSVKLSKSAYLDWAAPGSGLRHDVQWSFALPVDKPSVQGSGGAGLRYTARRTPDGYVIEGSAPLKELGVATGGSIGFLVSLSDVDGEANLSAHSWAVKQVMMVPNEPNYTYWSDPRNCGRLVVE